jgi:PPM family protein phosphatase
VIVADVVEDSGGRGRLDPVIDGAAGDNIGQRQVDPRSAAGRAALADPQPPPAPPPTLPPGGGPSARRRPLRLLLVAVAALVVVVAGAVGTYMWALGHWFVGVEGNGDDEQVAVFRGLDVSIVGFDFFELDRATSMALADLTPAARSRVRGGITADDASDADRILAALRGQRLPLCRTTGSTQPSPTPSPAPETSTPGAIPGATSPEATAAPVPAPTAAPTDGGTPAPSTSARTTTSSEPGVDCREGD